MGSRDGVGDAEFSGHVGFVYEFAVRASEGEAVWEFNEEEDSGNSNEDLGILGFSDGG